jgi:ABC-type antimicrobial peptide transport system permease subunit
VLARGYKIKKGCSGLTALTPPKGAPNVLLIMNGRLARHVTRADRCPAGCWSIVCGRESAFRLAVGVSAHDPITISAFAALLVTVALAANYIPAYRATRIDPMVALRYE